MQVKLVGRTGKSVIPFDAIFHIQMLTEDYPLIVEDVSDNRTSYQTSTVKFYKYQGSRLIVRTQNTRYEFEVNRSWKE